MHVMGILNVTPDSFSDGGRWSLPATALAHARQMIAQGATIIDVGAESTRPGSERITAEAEWARLEPVLTPLQVHVEQVEDVTLSVDTIHASTARRALALGVGIINDISGGCYDPDMVPVVAQSDARFVVQHWRGFPGDPNLDLQYPQGVGQVLDETLGQVADALGRGLRPEQVIIDPGLGFALSNSYSWRVVENLGTWTEGEYPVLVGASRKRFIRERYGDNVEEGTRIVTQMVAAAGAWAVRVHDVAANIDAINAANNEGIR